MQLIIVGLCLFSSLLFAEEAVISLDEIVVTATRPVVTGEVEEALNTGFAQTLKREQFDDRVTTLADAIAQQSSLQVRSSGGFGSFSSATLRGASSQQVLIFIDGLLLNDAAGGGVDLSSISLADVERVEVYRGATPLSLGSASIGGAINIRTLNAKTKDQGNISLSYGDFNTQKYSAFYTSKPADWDYVVSAEQFSSANNFEFINNNGTRLNPNDDRLEKRNNNAFEQTNLLVKLGYDFSKQQRLDALLQWFDKQQQIPVWNNHPSADTRFDVQRLQSQLRLISNNLGPYALNLSNTLAYLQTIEEYDDRKGNVGLGQQHDRNKTTSIKLRSFAELPLEQQLIRFIVELSEEKYQPSDLLQRRPTQDKKRRSTRLGIEDKVFFFDDQIMLNLALHHTYSRDTLSATQSVDHSYSDPRMGFSYIIHDSFTIKSNLGRYTRQASFVELFGDRGFFVANPELKNETGKNIDLGFEFNLIKPIPAIQHFSWQSALFYSEVEDIIVRTYNARGVGKAENINQATVSGIENIFNLDLVKNIGINFNVTYQNTINERKFPALENKQLPGRFKWNFNTRIDYRYAALSPFIEHRYQNEMYYDSPNLLRASNRNLINVGIGWKINTISITFEIRNLNNKTYEDFRGFPQPGRAFFSTLKISL